MATEPARTPPPRSAAPPAFLPLVPAGADLASSRLHPGWPIGVFVVTFLVYAALIPHFLLYSSPPTGDQPFYLMDTISLVQDGDLELSNNYANFDFDQFSKLAPRPPGFVGMDAFYPLPGQFANTPARPANERYSAHLPGLPVWLTPSWVIGGVFALWWPATIVFMCLLGALLAANIFLLAFEVSGRRGIALAVWAPLIFSNPLMSYSFLIFTELPVGLLLIYAFRRLARGWAANGPWRLLLVGASIAYIPWLAWRCVPITASMTAYALIQWWRARTRNGVQESGVGNQNETPNTRRSAIGILHSALVLGPVIVSAGLLAVYNLNLFGKLVPDTDTGVYGGRSPFHWPWAGGTDLARFASTAFALLFDRQMGLLIYAPIYLLAAVGMIALFCSVRRADRRLLGALALVTLPYLPLVVAWEFWNGLWCPPARYMTTLVPLLVAPLAMSLVALAGSRLYKILYGLLALPGFFFMAIFMYDPRLLWPNLTILAWLAESPLWPWRFDLRPLIPAFPPQLSVTDELVLPTQAAGIIAASVLIVLAGYLLMLRSPLVARPARQSAGFRAVAWVAALAVIGAGWYTGDAPYLQPRTVLTPVHTWPLVPRVDDPHGIAYLDGKVYVADYRNGVVGALDTRTGLFQHITPISASGPITFTHPGDIKTGPDGLLYVLNNGDGGQALYVMRPDGQVVRQVPLANKGPIGQGLGLGPDGSTYATDMGMLHKYGADGGVPLGNFGGVTGGFNNVMGVAVGNDGMVYVAENSAMRVQELDASGHFVRSYDLDCQPFYPAAAGDWIDVSCTRGLVSINTRTGAIQQSKGANNDMPSTPAGIAYGLDGTLYLVDFGILVACKVQH